MEQSTEIHLRRQGYTTYLPLTLVHKGKTKNQEKKTEPLFPNYIFVQLSDEENWHPIKTTIGVQRIIEFAGQPAKVPDTLIDALQQVENEQGIHCLSSADYERGDSVTMLNKPFEMVDAIIHTVKSDRIMLVMEILGNKTKVEVGYRDIKPNETN